MKSYNFRLVERKTRDLVWDEMAYYDLETATVDQLRAIGGGRNDAHEDPYMADLLDIRKVGITSFAIMFPAVLGSRKTPLTLWRPSLKDFCEAAGVASVEQSIEGRQFVSLAYYDETRMRTKDVLTGVLKNLAAVVDKGDKTLRICGYNNSKFDDLIFDGEIEEERMLHRYNIWQEKTEKWKRSKIVFVDLLPWANGYGITGGLLEVGKWVGMDKGSRCVNSVAEMLAYNIRDVEILPALVRKINGIHEQMQSSCLDAYTPAAGSRYFVARALRDYIKNRDYNGGEPVRPCFARLKKPLTEEQLKKKAEYDEYKDFVDDHPELYTEGKRYLESGGDLTFSEWLAVQEPEQFDPLVRSSVRATENFNLFGGRTEAFWARAEKPYYLDVNSLYTSVECSLLFPALEKDKNHYKIREKFASLEISERSVHTHTERGVVHDENKARMIRQAGNTYISALARTTYDLMDEVITPYWRKIADAQGWDTSTPEKLAKILNPHFLSGKLFFGTAWVKILGVKKEFRDCEERIRRYFPIPRKVGDYTTFSLSEGGIYQIQFYEIAFLGLFDWHFVSWTDPQGFVDQSALPVSYIPEPFPLVDALKGLYEARMHYKHIAADKTLPPEQCAAADCEQRGIKRILNAGYGILATRNYGKFTRVVSDAGIQKLLSPAKGEEVTLPYAEGEDPETGTAEMYAEIMARWRNKGTPSVFYTTLPSGKNVRVRAMYNGGEGLARYFIIEDVDDQARYARNSIPIWGIAITSGARFTLNSFIANAMLVPDFNVYYCDTDSIFCNKYLFDNLQKSGCIGEALGQLKNEKPSKIHPGESSISELYALAPKSYVLVLEDGTILPTLKGTGAVVSRTINQQGLGRPFISYTREALVPSNQQKRALHYHPKEKALIFDPEPAFQPGTPELVKHTAEVMALVEQAGKQRAEKAKAKASA